MLSISPSLDRQTLVFWVSLFLICTVSLASFSGTQRLVALANRAEHSQRILLGLDRLVSHLKDVETGARGYLITRDERYLAPYRTGRTQFGVTMRDLRRLAGNDQSLRLHLDSLEQLGQRRIAQASAMVDGRMRGRAANDLLAFVGAGKQTMDRIRGEAAAVIAAEQNAHWLQAKAVAQQTHLTNVTMAVGVILSVAALAWLFRARAREMARRRTVENKLRVLNAELERRVAERTRALSAANEALCTSEARSRATFEIDTVGVIYFDKEGRLLDANDAFLAMSGYSRAELEAGDLSWRRLTPPEWIEASERTFSELMATGRTSPYEKQYIRKDGSRWWGGFAAKMLPEGIGCKFVVDISRRKAAEDETRRYRMLIEQSSDFICMVDLDGKAIFANEGARRMVGLPEGFDWSTVDIFDFFLPEDRSFVECEILPQLLAGEEWVGEFRFRHFGTGEAIPVWYNAFPIKDAAGRVTALATVTRDIGLRKWAEARVRKSEARLRKSEARLRQALDIGRMGASEWEVRTNEVIWSDGIYTSLGFAPGEVEANHDLYLHHVHPDDRPGLVAALQHCPHGHQVFAQSYRIVRRDGEIGWCEARGIVESDDDNQPARIIAITADVTDRHKAEAALQELQAELSHVLRLNAMGMMASTLAHELNQPLTAVTSYVETARAMLAEPDPETLAIVRQAMDKAASSAVHAGQILHRLRDFMARGDSDKRREALPELINDAAGLVLIGARDKGIQVDLQLAPEATFVLTDRVQIQQVLVNLIRNAVEAMAGGERRELTITAVATADGQAEVSVADTGPGLAPEVVEQLFQPFVSTKRQGMGLGLSISRTIIEAHGGKLWAKPNPDGGTVFAFTLPLANHTARDQ